MSPFIFEYGVPFNGFPAKCQVQIETIGTTNRSTKLVILTELDDNTGASITNAAEHIASHLCLKHAIDPGRIIWIEHYPPTETREEESYDLVTFHWDGYKASEPDWCRISSQWVRELLERA